MGGGGPGRTLKWTARDFAVPDGQPPMGEPSQEWSFGDVEAGFAEASLALDETFVTQDNSHHSMEPRTTMSYWENGKCHVHTGCQSHTAALGGISRQRGVGNLGTYSYVAGTRPVADATRAAAAGRPQSHGPLDVQTA